MTIEVLNFDAWFIYFWIFDIGWIKWHKWEVIGVVVIHISEIRNWTTPKIHVKMWFQTMTLVIFENLKGWSLVDYHGDQVDFYQ